MNIDVLKNIYLPFVSGVLFEVVGVCVHIVCYSFAVWTKIKKDRNSSKGNY